MSLRRPTTPRVEPVPKMLERARPVTKAANVQATLSHHRRIFKTYGQVFELILNDGDTPRRQRELVILRMGWNCQSEYEFGQHTLMGRDAGLSDEEIYAVTRPLSTFPWAAADRCLLQMVDDLYANDMVSDETWAELSARWEPSDLVELVMTCLTYRTVSGFLNTFGVQLDEGVPGWPDASGTR